MTIEHTLLDDLELPADLQWIDEYDDSADLVGQEQTVSITGALIVQASAFELPFAEGTFDYVFSLGVLHHTGDTRKAIGRSRVRSRKAVSSTSGSTVRCQCTSTTRKRGVRSA